MTLPAPWCRLYQFRQAVFANLKPYGPLMVRLVLGVVFMAHGADKLFNTFGGGGIDATAEQFNELGLHPAHFHAIMAGISELGGGLLVLLGLATRAGALLIAGTMVVAILTVHLSGGLFARDGGFEYPLVILGSALFLVANGGGALAIDRWIERCYQGPAKEPCGDI